MNTIHRTRLPVPEAELRARLAAYKSALDAHRFTEGVPAPFPEFKDELDAILNDPDQDFVVEDDPVSPSPPPPTPEQLANRQRRADLDNDARVVDFLDRLNSATPATLDAFVDNNVTDLAGARTVFKRILLVLAVRS